MPKRPSKTRKGPDSSDDDAKQKKRPRRNAKKIDTEWVKDDLVSDADADAEAEDADAFAPEIHIHLNMPQIREDACCGEESDMEAEPNGKFNRMEQAYLSKLSKRKQADIKKTIEGLSALHITDNDVPYKFKLLEMPMSNFNKVSILRKLEMLDSPILDSTKIKLQNRYGCR